MFYFLFLVVVHCHCHLSNASSEPVCSQLDKDMKIMEFIAETKHEIKEMAKDLRRTEEYLLAVLEHRKGEMKNLANNLDDTMERGMQNLTEELKVLKTKVEEIEFPRIAFSAYQPKDRNLQSNEALVLTAVTINEGSGYNNTSGKFTAPIAGMYHFTAHVCNTFGLVIHYAIVKDGEWVAPSQQFEQADENGNKYASCSSVSALLMLEPGEKVWIMCTSGYSSVSQFHEDSHRRNSFIGYLLHK